eukprot:SM000067S20374  [mRNA]  locus=s67:567345:569215:- [translate_table: standard]
MAMEIAAVHSADGGNGVSKRGRSRGSATTAATDGGADRAGSGPARPPPSTSQALLHVEDHAPSLVVCRPADVHALPSPPMLQQRPPTTRPMPPSAVLARLREFLPQMDNANQQLRESLQAGQQDDVNIEVLTSADGAPHIEMDLMLGLAELKTPEAVAAAEQALAGLSRDEADDGYGQSDEAEHSESNEEDCADHNIVERVRGPMRQSRGGLARPKRPKIVELQ